MFLKKTPTFSCRTIFFPQQIHSHENPGLSGVTPCRWVPNLRRLEGTCHLHLHVLSGLLEPFNAGNHPPNDAAAHHTKPESSIKTLLESKLPYSKGTRKQNSKYESQFRSVTDQLVSQSARSRVQRNETIFRKLM